jgi:hypothetical protein
MLIAESHSKRNREWGSINPVQEGGIDAQTISFTAKEGAGWIGSVLLSL